MAINITELSKVEEPLKKMIGADQVTIMMLPDRAYTKRMCVTFISESEARTNNSKDVITELMDNMRLRLEDAAFYKDRISAVDEEKKLLASQHAIELEKLKKEIDAYAEQLSELEKFKNFYELYKGLGRGTV